MCFKEDTEDTNKSSKEYINTIQIIHYIEKVLTKRFIEIENYNVQIVEKNEAEEKAARASRKRLARY